MHLFRDKKLCSPSKGKVHFCSRSKQLQQLKIPKLNGECFCLRIASKFIEVKDAEVRVSGSVIQNWYPSRKCAKIGKYLARSCLQSGQVQFSNQVKQSLSGLHLTILIKRRWKSARDRKNVYSIYHGHKMPKIRDKEWKICR